ncbi:K+-transporting ATPase, A subunit [Myxococcus xanthus DK 1622]|uniref:Potassium-transporting ATPase potassium-binding subunit n=2 Tax=Myxococcus xanthus TaxID=34 RepID=Q1DFX6_MYXXD|nr:MULTISPECIES: potassium-transporting ATPase subunit KdpA [Myxococcus]AAK81843.1 KdpA [Myxococcus xanthus]ABF90399.1 K+-transporting ATPase, A subunit [Myxococcus xanthus DK 1622]NOJ54560.1 potassium-transporting ATPase subunit KdpA [Myxococcus xanthus]QPM79895.1 potassium-transporting ATPase subunit KdpA [Myxococcus xanthus]QVW68959.1 potassium-transporting ATPase subunit KdpA [Myxococcus xanthus DZ2]
MSFIGWSQILLFFALVLAVTKPLGAYLFRVLEGDTRPLPRVLGPLERLLLRLCGAADRHEQTWVAYASSLLAFSLFSVLIVYGLQRVQHLLPLNPQGLGAVGPELAFNTAVSFTANTNWQSYAGESTLSYLTQMVALAWQNFVSAAAGIGVALALARGFTRRPGPDGQKTLGNFWVDVMNATLYVLLPLSLLYALFLVSQGVLQNFAPYAQVVTLEGASQTLAQGPVASQEAIKTLGTNGGGFFNANSAHPFENPTPFTNLVQMLSIFAIPAALTYTYGKMAGDTRQGWALLSAMSVLFLVGVAAVYAAESQANPALSVAGQVAQAGNMEGKEVRYGIAASSLFAAVTTAASCGAVNAMHDSFTPLGGLVPMVNMQLGEVVFGGVGAGLYGILVMVVLSVFIAGLMVGRTPEYLGKKIEAREMKLAMLYVLVFPLFTLGFSGLAAVLPQGVSSLNNAGPHGLSEILYAYTSGTANNGSAFAGLNANTPFWNITLGVAMLGGRFLMMVPALAIAGSMVGKKVVPAGPGTFPTHGVLFTGLLVSVIVIVGALTFFPALSLSPIVEHFLAGAGKRY